MKEPTLVNADERTVMVVSMPDMPVLPDRVKAANKAFALPNLLIHVPSTLRRLVCMTKGDFVKDQIAMRDQFNHRNAVNPDDAPSPYERTRHLAFTVRWRLGL